MYVVDIFEFLADLVKGGIFAVIVKVPLLQSYLDESADERQQRAFCVGAFLVNEEHRKAIQDAWIERLQIDHIGYFRTSDCKAVKGAFGHLRKKYGSLHLAREAAAKIREDLETILVPSHWIGFGLAVDVPGYTEARKVIPESALFYSEDPTVAAFSQMIYTVARTVRKEAPGHRVAFVFDESSSSAKIMAAYDAVKAHHPVIARSMATIAPGDDKVTPPLQMADLLASIVREAFLKYKEAGTAFPEKWNDHFAPDSLGIWDGEHTARSLTQTFNSKRFREGRLVRQPQPHATKYDIKMQRRLAAKKERNSAGTSGGACRAAAAV